jgi:hypothetical protein
LTVEEDENLEDSDLEIFVPVEDRAKEITMVCLASHPYTWVTSKVMATNFFWANTLH